MGDLATAGPELLIDLLTDAPEVLTDITYRRGDQDTLGVKAIPDKLKFGEADGQHIKITDTAWLIFSHQLVIAPHADDWIVVGSVEHFVVAVSAEDPAGILWRVITRG